MAWRPLLILLSLLITGCAEEPARRPPTAEEVALAYSPVGSGETDAPPSEDGRQSRPAQEPAPRRDNITPARWDGETTGFKGVCLPAIACVGVFDSGGFRPKRLGAGPDVWSVRMTVTWDAVADSTETLQVTIADANATGTSPLVVKAKLIGTDNVYATIEGIMGDLVVDLPRQPYHAVAEFNV